jgi:hypothetical protein
MLPKDTHLKVKKGKKKIEMDRIFMHIIIIIMKGPSSELRSGPINSNKKSKTKKFIENKKSEQKIVALVMTG